MRLLVLVVALFYSYEHPHGSLEVQQQGFGSKGQDSLPPIAARHPPTLEECKLVIKHLENKTSQQAHELVQIKADLRDVLYSHKWTPDAFLMARAYITDNPDHPDQGYVEENCPETIFGGFYLFF